MKATNQNGEGRHKLEVKECMGILLFNYRKKRCIEHKPSSSKRQYGDFIYIEKTKAIEYLKDM